MKFRPCIDIHNGKVKQIVGGSLKDNEDFASENFVSEKDSVFFAALYHNLGFSGGHVIILNSRDSEYYPDSRSQALAALALNPGTFQAGGGIDPENASLFLDAGASHVIVTSYIFSDGMINYGHLSAMKKAVGKERLVLDLSCRKKGDSYYIVTDRWQKFTDQNLDSELLEDLSHSCDEFLIHAVDVEGKASGPEKDLIEILAEANGFPITYAGGISSYDDIELIRTLGNEKLDYTIGSALSIFGGTLDLELL